MIPAADATRILLRDVAPLANGHLRAVYAHPDRADWLIKVMRPEVVARRWGGKARWYKRLARVRHYATSLRELKEYIAVMARHPDGDPPIVRPRGLVETDLGLGLVTERIVGDDGGLAPTVLALLRESGGLAPWIDSMLVRLLDELQAHDVIVGDLHVGNIAYGRGPRELARPGAEPRFILIDGYGEKNLLPRCSMSTRFNHWHNRHLFQRMRERLPLTLARDRAAREKIAR